MAVCVTAVSDADEAAQLPIDIFAGWISTTLLATGTNGKEQTFVGEVMAERGKCDFRLKFNPAIVKVVKVELKM